MEGEDSGDWGSDNEGEEILDFIAASAEADEEAPDGWTPQQRTVEKDEPMFESVDNPGGWSDFIFCPAFKSKDDKRRVPSPDGTN
eukprot:scaffold115025_cov61-Attheya_sp.AAC.1